MSDALLDYSTNTGAAYSMCTHHLHAAFTTPLKQRVKGNTSESVVEGTGFHSTCTWTQKFRGKKKKTLLYSVFPLFCQK